MIDENSTFGGFLTTIGEAKQANANALKTPWKLTNLLLGDAHGTDPVPAPDQTQLVNQVYRAAINQLSIDPDNPGILIAEVVLPPNIGGWWIRELGIEDEDGDFVAVANCPPSYKPLLAQGSGRNQVVRMHLILSNTANVELKVDPSVVLATRKYVDDGDAALKEQIEQAIAAAGYQFANYDPQRVYETGEVARGSDGRFYEFYDRDLVGTVKGVDPTDPLNRPHIWMVWDGNKPGQTIEWRSETLPEGYIVNDGNNYSRADYRRIFAAWGTTHGAGDGSTTFGSPDDRGQFKRGLDQGRGVDSGRDIAAWQKATLVGGYDDNSVDIDSTFLRSKQTVDYGSDTFSANDYPGGTGMIARSTASISLGSSLSISYFSATRPQNNAVIWLTKI